MSALSALNVGSQALNAAQRALDVTGQNVSNVNTEGYSRQRVLQTSRGASVIPALFSTTDVSAGGVDITGTQRIRDGFLEARAHQEHATYAGLTSLSGTYTDLESTFGEPSDTGLAAQMSTFWNSWQDVANNPGDAGPTGLVLEQAKTVAGRFNGFATQLSAQWAAARDDLGTNVAEVNTLTADVARLNGAIRSATLAGGSPNELADQRDVLVLRIAESTGAVASAGEDGVVNLTLSGQTLVSATRNVELKVVVGPNSGTATMGTVGITWAMTGLPATAAGGTIEGQRTALNATIPGAMADLDAVAVNLAVHVNRQQWAGYNQAGAHGAPVFTVGTASAPVTAATLHVVMTDPEGIATSSAGKPDFNGENATTMSTWASNPAGPDAQFQKMMVQLGIQAQTNQRQTVTQQAVRGRIDADRQSVAGVNLDEEMTNLVAFQHAYSSAAKYISVIDATMDTLINMVR